MFSTATGGGSGEAKAQTSSAEDGDREEEDEAICHAPKNVGHRPLWQGNGRQVGTTKGGETNGRSCGSIGSFAFDALPR